MTGASVKPYLRPIDRWFIDEVLPHTRAYHDQARRWASDPAVAEDIVQEAYARIVALTNWGDLANPKAYTMLVIRNLAIDRLRQASILPFDRGIDTTMMDVRDDRPDALAQAAARQELDRVRAVIAALPPQCRRVVEMRKVEDCSPREIADRLGISVSTVEKHLVKGLRIVMRTLAAPAEVDMGTDPEREHEQGRSSGRGSPVADPARRGNG
jgi:RNA polymerase sigma-70 factor (ECF subfamily)